MMILNRFHIPTKMGIPAATSIFCMLVIALLGGSVIWKQSDLLDRLFNRSFTREADVQTLGDRLNITHAALYRTTILRTANASPQAVDEEIKALNEHLSKLDEQADAFKKHAAQDADEASLFERIEKNTSSYHASVSSFVELLNVGVDPLDFLQELQAAYTRLHTDSRDYLAYQRSTAGAAYAEVDRLVQNMVLAFVIMAVLAILITVGVALSVGFNIARPLVRLNNAMELLAGGNHDCNIPGADRGDEIGSMARTVQVFKENAIQVLTLSREQEAMRVRTAQEQHDTMNKLASDLEMSVKTMLNAVLQSADSMRNEATAMLESARQTSHHSDSVASSAQEVTAEVEGVASGAEQLLASINEITRSIIQSTDLARDAVQEAVRTDTIVQGLTEASRKIGEVAGLIGQIASQTNLLALNATIEAARAGDAGRGFAIVAGEVKNLAGQTARATEEIASEIAAVQAATASAVSAVRTIAASVKQVDQSLNMVAAAVEEQGSATREISLRSQRAASNTVAVLQEMKQVQVAAETTGESAGHVQTTTEVLASNFGDLDREIGAFITRITG